MSIHKPVTARSTSAEEVIRVDSVSLHFRVTSGNLLRRKQAPVKAVDEVTISVERGECLAIVGESGCGKSTLARVVVGLLKPTSGTVTIEGQETSALNAKELRRMRQRVQLVLQDPLASLDPRMTVSGILNEAMLVHRIGGSAADRTQKALQVLEQVGLNRSFLDRYPSEMSGGQRQRVAIAKALACSPDILVLDEPVSALDVSVQAQIINLLVELQRELDLTYIVITHDLALVEYIAETTCVMYLGAVVEHGDTKDVINDPIHPYTAGLLSAVARPDPEYEKSRNVELLPGTVPSASAVPSGCRFHTRCRRALQVGAEHPGLDTVSTAIGELPAICVSTPPAESEAPGTNQCYSCHFPGGTQ